MTSEDGAGGGILQIFQNFCFSADFVRLMTSDDEGGRSVCTRF